MEYTTKQITQVYDKDGNAINVLSIVDRIAGYDSQIANLNQMKQEANTILNKIRAIAPDAVPLQASLVLEESLKS